MWKVVLLALCVYANIPSIEGGSSPNSEYVKLLFGDSGARYSNNIIEDANLDVPGLVKKYGYPIEMHNVTTPDGYILGMHRIRHGRDANNVPDENKPVIFLMHGIVSSSADWVIMGPGAGFAYILAEAGFDVWMGNARGNFYSRTHVRLNPDAILNTNYWKFSWDEIGNIDLPTMIDYVLVKTNRQRLHYVGHSQGTTAFFVMNSLRPVYNDKIISMHALAPVAYMAHNRNTLLLFMAPMANDVEKISSLMGIGELLPNNAIMSWAGQNLCMDESTFQPVCSNILFLIGGWNVEQLNKTMMPVIFGHSPAGSSVRQFVHYGQGIADKGFRRFDHGSRMANRKAYGSRRPPNYDLSKVTAPVFLHYSFNDPLAEVQDVERLFRELGRPVGKFLVPLPAFNHIDYIWAINAKELIYDRVINLVRAVERSGIDNLVL
ncbi:lipase 3 [Manduca sexta]|uniref:Lipase n=1 Tax=Manduca sexta TaxID=7130 RepID=A0A921ZKK0_MANSE|nr:lipase 3 [Manduca sexta]KAG6459451.1 hypothetical protein O3G_MSEX011404 [Manduca sexta]UXP71921.1 esterase [Manduca sexta]